MTKTIALSGKGGTGKTTLTALLIKYFLAQNKLILAVDADPNSNLDSKLGVKAETSIGLLREEIMKNIENIPSGMSKSDWLEYKIRLAITEAKGFDLLTIGRPEGSGCYCYVNQLLRTCLDKISDRYDYVVIDCEAGMEHLSRRTTRDVDVLIIASDPTKEGILTAGRIKKLAEEMELKIKNFKLAINFMRGLYSATENVSAEIPHRNLMLQSIELPESLKVLISEIGFEYKNVALIPYDENIEKCSLENCPVINISENSKAYRAVEKSAKIEFG